MPAVLVSHGCLWDLEYQALLEALVTLHFLAFLIAQTILWDGENITLSVSK
jgi:hypothetical protein